MALGLVPVLLAGGGIAYVAAQKSAEGPAPAPLATPQRLAPTGGSTIAEAQVQTQTQAPLVLAEGMSSPVFGNTARSSLYLAGLSQVQGWALPPAQPKVDEASSILALGAFIDVSAVQTAYAAAENDPEFQKKLDYLKAQMAKNFQDMSDVAKVEAAEILNRELKLDPPLTGHEDWDETARRAGKATGATVGAAACVASGYAAAAAPICGLVGAYLGEKLGPLLKKTYPEVRDWCEDRWGTLEGWAHDAYDWFGSIF